MSLRQILTLIVLMGSLVPTYLVGSLLIDRHSQQLMEQKQLKLDSSRQGIEQSVKQELTNIINLTNWYSRDRLLIMGSENILYSAIVAQKLYQFKKLADPITTTFVLDKQWNPMYESNGSLFHLEQSQLLKSIKEQQGVYNRGNTYHIDYRDESLVIDGGQNGIAFVTPMLSYTLLPGSEYEPKGYLVVLVSYDALIALSKPYLFDEESVAIRYLRSRDEIISAHASQVLHADSFFSPLYFDIDHQFSDVAREQELKLSQSQLYQAMVITLFAITLLGLIISHFVIRPVKALESVVRRYHEGAKPRDLIQGFQFREFKQVLSLTEKLWRRVDNQMRELEVQNLELQKAHSNVQQSNQQLEHFNQDLERKVDEKTLELRDMLSREERYQQRLVQVIEFFSNRTGVTYRTIPMVCNLFLGNLFTNHKVSFSFERSRTRLHEPVCSVEGEVLGYLILDRSKLDEQQQMLVTVFVKQLASWLELETMARWDKLCGILNRKAFEEDFEYFRHLMLQERSSSLSMIMIDVNGLKPLNDRYGHDRGDRLLRRTIELIHPLLSSNDSLYRVGGDEFLILVRNASLDELDAKVEQLKSHKGSAGIALPDGQSYEVTYSVGAASSIDTKLEQLYSRADADMYSDKREYYQEAEPSL